MRSFFGSRSNRSSVCVARLNRMREEGHARGSAEGRLFLRALGKTKFSPHEVHDWLSRVVAEGRAELEAENAVDREIEAWDMACRVAFLLIAWRDWTRDASSG
jgi:hypothetical protein